jgi:hypothetical protein
MSRSLSRGLASGGLALVCLTLLSISGSAETSQPEAANIGASSMRFALLTEGPATVCGAQCRQLISASGMITADTSRQFLTFVHDSGLQGTHRSATVVLESDGGAVLGALELGRAIRRLGFATTVGRVVERKGGMRYGEVTARADCQSMCTFVLLGGVQRQVPHDARVLVHQIWLGDRREDAVAANYTAEDLVVVQRDIGSIMQYTVEMGGDVDLVALSLKVPPWEPMRVLTRDELRRMRLDVAVDMAATASLSKTAAGPAPIDDIAQDVPINGRGWLAASRAGHPALARNHPLTLEGEKIGSFDLILTCGPVPDTYSLTYRESRFGPSGRELPRGLSQVVLTIDDQVHALKITSSDRKARRGELESVATVALPGRVVRTLASDDPAALMVETDSVGNSRTVIRVGNAGFRRGFRDLDKGCGQSARGRGDGRTQAAIE